MKTRQGLKVIELRPQGYTIGNKLVLSGAEMLNADGGYIGFWHAREMPRDIKRELVAELAANWLPAQYDRDLISGRKS